MYTWTLDELVERIKAWAADKGILESGDLKTQYIKTIEEAGELGAAIIRDDKSEMADAFGDMFVTIVIGAALADLDLVDVVRDVLDIIEGRSGKMVDGAFVKEGDL